MNVTCVYWIQSDLPFTGQIYILSCDLRCLMFYFLEDNDILFSRAM